MGKQLSFWEASFTIMGAGVGAGILAVPFLASRTGAVPFLAIVAIAYLANCLLHLMLVEVLFRHGSETQLVEVMRTYVFRGRVGAAFLWVLFALLALAFVANLSAYLSGEAEILARLAGLPRRAAELAVYAASAGVVFFGLKAVGLFEKFSSIILFALILVLVMGGIAAAPRPIAAARGTGKDALALYGMVMYGFYAFFSVPQAVQGLAHDKRKAVRAVFVGLALNGLLMILITFLALRVSRTVTPLAIVGITESLGPWAEVAGSLFAALAMVTSFWSVSLALADILRERIKLHRNAAWLLATLPSLLLLYAGAGRFMDFLRLAGGATALIVVLTTIPLYRNARRFGPVSDPAWTLGKFGHPAFLAAAFLLAVLMAAGSLVGL
jgi:amino acid permease